MTEPVDMMELLRAAARHEDPWFASLATATLGGLARTDPGGDRDLVSRLEAQTAARPYTAPSVEVDEHLVDGPHGPVPVRVYRQPAQSAGRPLLVWHHGGGFVGGDIHMPEADATARELAARVDAVVVSVDYRLAVRGVHFPVPHDDATAAFLWARDRVEDWGASDQVVIGGASAGANLAAGVALRLRDEGRPPAGAMLLYPLVHPVLPPASEELLAKLRDLPDRHGFRGAGFVATVENYLGGPTGTASPYTFAALGDLDGFPPALVINCEYDGLRASGEAFVEGLRAAGVSAEQLLAPDVLHGHINSPWLPQAQQSYADMAAWLATFGRR